MKLTTTFLIVLFLTTAKTYSNSCMFEAKVVKLGSEIEGMRKGEVFYELKKTKILLLKALPFKENNEVSIFCKKFEKDEREETILRVPSDDKSKIKTKSVINLKYSYRMPRKGEKFPVGGPKPKWVFEKVIK